MHPQPILRSVQQRIDRFLRLAVRLDGNDEGIEEAARIWGSDGLQEEALLREATWHRIRPQALRLLKGMGDRVTVPDTLLSRLEEVTRFNAVRQMAYTRLFLQLREALPDMDIFPFKGFILGRMAYADPALRESTDLDLLIHPRDLHRVRPVMTAMGFQPMAGYPDWPEERILEIYGEYNYDYFQNGQRLYHLEFHGALSGALHKLDIRLNDLMARCGPSPFMGREVPMLDPSALFLVTALHHGGKDGWDSLRQVLDVGLLVRKYGAELDWTWIRSMAASREAWPTVLTGLRLAHEVCGVALPAALTEEVRTGKMEALTADRQRMLSRPAGWWSSFRFYGLRWWYHFRSRERWGDRLRWVRDYFRELTDPAPGDRGRGFPARVMRLLRRISKGLRDTRRQDKQEGLS